MQKLVRIVIVAALIALGFWGWRVLFPSPEKVIRSRLAKLADYASFDSKQGTIAQAFSTEAMAEFFTTDVEIQLEARGFPTVSISGREELKQAIMVARSRLGNLKVEFLDVNVKLGPDKQTAVANLTCRATPVGRDFIVQEANFLLKKVDGKWLIYRIEPVKTLS